MHPRRSETSPPRPLVAVAALLFGLLGLGGTAAAVQPAAGRPRLGEAFTFSMRILGLFDAGRARLAIAPPARLGAGTVVNVVGEAEATGLVKALTGLHDDYRLVLDGATLLPRKMEIAESGFRTRTVTMQLDGRRFDLLARKPGAERRIVGQLPSEPLEPVAVLLLLRTARLDEGDRLELILMDGTNFYQGSIEVLRREDVTTAMGTQRAIRLLCRGERVDDRGVKLGRPPRQATLWVSDDPYRLPLRVEAQTDYGTGEFELTSYEPARRPIPLPRRLVGITERPRGSAPPPQPTPPPTPAPVAAQPAAGATTASAAPLPTISLPQPPLQAPKLVPQPPQLPQPPPPPQPAPPPARPPGE